MRQKKSKLDRKLLRHSWSQGKLSRQSPSTRNIPKPYERVIRDNSLLTVAEQSADHIIIYMISGQINSSNKAPKCHKPTDVLNFIAMGKAWNKCNNF